MRKNILVTIIALVLFLCGFWIGSTQFQNNSDPDEEIETETDLEKEISELSPIYTVMGGLPKQDDKYRYLVDGWYGFRFRTTGSSCTDVDRNIDIDQNKKTDSILTKRIGKDWMQKFERTVDSLYAIDTLVTNIARNDIGVKNLIKLKSSKNTEKSYPSYKCYPTTSKFLKAVSIQWEGEIYNTTYEVSYMRVIVDINEKKVKKIETTEIKADPFSY
ncbi:MAG: hypothetical protein EOO46_14920 [Flavobacterium sp.]|nr:MAG: hypothetical protein EOO46_14920 [Flavobacterium sp.]